MDQNLFEKFLLMEMSCDLFSLKEKGKFPVWDFIRVNIFGEITKSSDATSTTSIKKRIRNLTCRFVKGFCFPCKVDYLFFYSPCFLNKDWKYYDRIAEDMIVYTKNSRCAYIASAEVFFNSLHRDNSMFLFNIFARLRCCFVKISSINYQIISSSILDTFGIKPSYEMVNYFYKCKVVEYYSCKYLLKWITPRKIFVSLDTRKGLYQACRELKIPVVEIQHGTLIYQYPSYSYPRGVSNASNIAYADIFAMPGKGWGTRNNIPCKEKVVLGNSRFVINSNDICDSGNIIIVSNVVHKDYLIPLAMDISRICSNKIIYKLHPHEYSQFNIYVEKFKGYASVEVASPNTSMSDLLATCSLLITIASTVFFEAKSLGKRVAVYKVDNYYTLEPYVNQSCNTCIIDSAKDVLEALKMPEYSDGEKYYMPFDKNMAHYLLKL